MRRPGEKTTELSSLAPCSNITQILKEPRISGLAQRLCYGWVRGAARSRATFSILRFRTNQKNRTGSLDCNCCLRGECPGCSFAKRRIAQASCIESNSWLKQNRSNQKTSPITFCSCQQLATPGSTFQIYH